LRIGYVKTATAFEFCSIQVFKPDVEMLRAALLSENQRVLEMTVRVIRKSGWTGRCPACRGYFLYTKFNNAQATPFFYCDRRSDVLLRDGDQEQVRAAYKSGQASDNQLKELWDMFIENAPVCVCGGKFRFWTYISCPHCQKELPHPTEPEFTSHRIQEPFIIVLDARHVLKDTVEDSYQVLVSVD
jgi:hypothetical protein